MESNNLPSSRSGHERVCPAVRRVKRWRRALEVVEEEDGRHSRDLAPLDRIEDALDAAGVANCNLDVRLIEDFGAIVDSSPFNKEPTHRVEFGI